ncbi:MAG: ribose 5-phosphate isomerase B [Clostridia bacterium]
MIAIGSDHGGYKLKEEIKKYLEEKEIEYIDCGTFNEENVNYPEIAKAVALEIENKECNKGIVVCRSGIGMSIVANKFKGIRCAKCNDEEEAKFSRMHNDANMLALGADYIDTDKAIRIVRMWIATEFQGGRHEERVKMIEEIENENMK